MKHFVWLALFSALLLPLTAQPAKGCDVMPFATRLPKFEVPAGLLQKKVIVSTEGPISFKVSEESCTGDSSQEKKSARADVWVGIASIMDSVGPSEFSSHYLTDTLTVGADKELGGLLQILCSRRVPGQLLEIRSPNSISIRN